MTLIEYVERKHIDDTKWDNCILRSFNGNLYGYSWFLDIVAENWSALVENDYERVFPLVFRQKFGIHYIYQPFFTQQLGLYSTTMLNSEVLSAFFHAIPAKFRHVEINLNTLNNAEKGEYLLRPQLNHELDLIHHYDKIRAGYSENLIRNLKKAEKAGLTLSASIQPDTVVDLFRQNRGHQLRHLKETDYLKLKRMIFTCIYKGIAGVWGAFDTHNQLCAGAFFIQSNNKAIFLFSGLSAQGRESGAMPFLIDAYLKQHAGRHLTFDFDGSNDPNLARFYKSFGSKECIYNRLEINRLPAPLKMLFRIYRDMKRGMD